MSKTVEQCSQYNDYATGWKVEKPWFDTRHAEKVLQFFGAPKSALELNQHLIICLCERSNSEWSWQNVLHPISSLELQEMYLHSTPLLYIYSRRAKGKFCSRIKSKWTPPSTVFKKSLWLMTPAKVFCHPGLSPSTFGKSRNLHFFGKAE